jgi:hypothetical protein
MWLLFASLWCQAAPLQPPEPLSVGPVSVAAEIGNGIWFGANDQQMWRFEDRKAEEVGQGARSLAVLDGSEVELVVCGGNGLWIHATEPTVVSDSPCTAVVAVHDDPPTLASVDETGKAHLWILAYGTWQAVASQQTPSGEPLLAVDPEKNIYLSAVGSAELAQWTPKGVVKLDPQGAVQGLLAAQGSVWWTTQDGRLRSANGEVHDVHASPGPPKFLRTNDGGLYLIPHPKQLGLLTPQGQEVLTPSEEHIVAVLDVDANGCDDVVLTNSLLMDTCTPEPAVFSTPSPPKTEPAPFSAPGSGPAPFVPPGTNTQLEERVDERKLERDRRRVLIDAQPRGHLLGIPVPTFVRSDGAMGSGEPASQQWITTGAGIAFGGSAFPQRVQSGGSPVVSGALEWGPRRIHAHIGFDTAPTFIWLGDTFGGMHLLNVTSGISLGGPQLYSGGFVTLGLVNVGMGARAVWLPWERPNGTAFGLETRATLFNGGAGQFALMGVTRIAKKSKRNPLEFPRKQLGENSFLACRRLGASAGLGAAASSTNNSWENIGQTGLEWRFSPALSAGCEMGARGASALLTVNSAPWVRWRSHVIDGADRTYRHMGSVTTGMMFGGDKARFGPTGSVGVWTQSGGMRVVITPFRKGLTNHGIELRGNVLFPSAPAAEGMVLYHAWMNPRVTAKEPT